MGQTLCALAAGLLMGQAQEISTIQTAPVQPACKNCAAAAAANSGWTPVQSSTQTWSQTGTWTPTTGWTWRNSSSNGAATEFSAFRPRFPDQNPNFKVQSSPDNPSFLTRISDRVGTLFGPKQAIVNTGAGWQTVDAHASSMASTMEPPLLNTDVAVQPAIQPAQVKPCILLNRPADFRGTDLCCSKLKIPALKQR